MHTCDLDWGRTVALMVWLLLMLRLRLWEDVSDWLGPIRSKRSAEAGATAGGEAGVTMFPKRLVPLLSAA